MCNSYCFSRIQYSSILLSLAIPFPFHTSFVIKLFIRSTDALPTPKVSSINPHKQQQLRKISYFVYVEISVQITSAQIPRHRMSATTNSHKCQPKNPQLFSLFKYLHTNNVEFKSAIKLETFKNWSFTWQQIPPKYKLCFIKLDTFLRRISSILLTLSPNCMLRQLQNCFLLFFSHSALKLPLPFLRSYKTMNQLPGTFLLLSTSASFSPNCNTHYQLHSCIWC